MAFKHAVLDNYSLVTVEEVFTISVSLQTLKQKIITKQHRLRQYLCFIQTYYSPPHYHYFLNIFNQNISKES